MKNSKTRHTVGLGALLALTLLVVRSIVVAIRRRSIAAAVTAFAAAVGGFGVACALLADVCAPDAEGAYVRMPETDPCEAELFEGEEAAAATQLIAAALDLDQIVLH